MPLDEPHAPLDSPHLTGVPTAPTPGINDSSNQIANMSVVQALARRPPPGNQPITLSGDASGRGTSAIAVQVNGLRGRPLTPDAPADKELYIWDQASHSFQLVRSEELGALPGGATGQVQVNHGAGQFGGITISGDAVLDTTTGVETVTGLQGRRISPTAPTDNQALVWNGMANRWQPGAGGGGGGGGSPGAPIGSLQTNAGAGAFAGMPSMSGDMTLNTSSGVATLANTPVVPGSYTNANLAVDGKGRVTSIASGASLPDAPSDGSSYGRLNGAWATVAPVFSPALTGTPTAFTAAPGTNTTQLATTGFVAASFAPLASPVFTGDPRAPTPATADNDTSIATTAFVKAQGYTAGGPFAPLASPVFTGDPQAPTPATIDNDTSIATTAFVKAQGYAPLASPGFSGTPTAPTPTAGNSSTQLATTAFVATSFAPLASPIFTGDPTAPTPATADNDTSIATTAFVKAQGYVTGGPFAPLASPVFTGNPTAPTPAPGDNDTSIATTAFVTAANLPFAPLASPALTGNPTAPTPTPGDNDTSIATTAFVTASFLTITSASATYAPLASPLFTGDPRAPTPLTADNDTSIATTAFVKAQGYLVGNQTITLTGDVTGSGNTSIGATVARLQGRAVSATAPLDTQVLAYSTGTNQWQPTNPSSSPGAPAGLTTQVQFNNAGTLAGSAGATFSTTQLTSLAVGLGGDQAGDIWFRGAGGNFARLGPAANGSVLQLVSGFPAWTTIATGAGTVNTGSNPQIAQYTGAGSTVVGGVTVSGDATIASGGALTLATQAGLTPGTFQGITFNAKGLATAAVDQAYLTIASAAATYAPLASPALTGNPTAPTPTAGDNDTSIATTAFVTASFLTIATASATYAPLASPALTGNPTAPTPAPGDNDTSIATTAFVATSFLPSATAATTYAPLASPIFTGDPQAPTPATADNDTSIATTAFVKAQGYVTGGPFAPLASPALTGNPTAPTPAPGDSDTSIATTAFVATSFAPLASPAFTGNPTAPTPTAGDNDTSLATTAFVATSFLPTATAAATYLPLAGGTITGTGPGSLTLRRPASLPTAPANTTAVVWAVGNAAEAPSVVVDAIGGIPAFISRRANGTGATAVASGDAIGQLSARGFFSGGTPGYAPISNARVQLEAAEAFTDVAQGTRINLQTTPLGSTTIATQATIGPLGVTIGNATAPSGGMLAGDINAANRVMINGVSVTAGGGLADAPSDGNFYVRRNAAWVEPDDTIGTGIAAGGTTQATGTPLTKMFNVIATVATAGGAVNLPQSRAGRRCGIKNSGANPLAVFPNIGDLARINTEVANAVGAIIQPGAMRWFEGESLVQWHT